MLLGLFPIFDVIQEIGAGLIAFFFVPGILICVVLCALGLKPSSRP